MEEENSRSNRYALCGLCTEFVQWARELGGHPTSLVFLNPQKKIRENIFHKIKILKKVEFIFHLKGLKNQPSTETRRVMKIFRKR